MNLIKVKEKLENVYIYITKNIAYLQAVYEKYNDNTTKTQEKQINFFYESIHGLFDDDYDAVVLFIKENPSVLPIIQSIFDYEEQRMNRNFEKMSCIVTSNRYYDDSYEINIPTAAVFIHDILNNDFPSFVFHNYTEEEAKKIFSDIVYEQSYLNIEENVMLNPPVNKPKYVY